VRIVLIHSPLVGPSTTAPLGDALRARGHATVSPDLRTALEADRPAAKFVDQGVEAAETADAVLAHSGAGVFLPLIAEAIDARAIVFVDAVVPEADGRYESPAEFVAFLDSRTDAEGRIQRWHDWWPAGTMTALVPDDRLRHRITEDTPRVPRSFYDASVPIPQGWTNRLGGYLQLSDSYDDDRERAASYGWKTRTIDGSHLDLAVRPEVVADAVIELLAPVSP
jgi:hypothetical protein